MRICAILPIKHQSTRVPGKNYRLFNGKPLFMIILDTLICSKQFEKIIIDTNSVTVKSLLASNYSDCKIIQIYNRPSNLWDGDIPMNTILENVIQQLNLDFDFYFQTHTTNPLLSIETIKKSINVFIDKHEKGFDSLFSVKKLQTRLYQCQDNKITALNHDLEQLLPTQDLEPLYEENSCIYMFKKDTLMSRKHRIGYHPFMFEMDDIESTDIDIETDFIIAESIHKCLILDKAHEQKSKGSSKVVLVTGASKGIGLSICQQFKNDNWIVVGTARHVDFNSEYIDLYISGDLSQSESITSIIKVINQKYQRLDCIINNAACQICKPIWEMEEQEWELVFNCNLKAIYLLIKNGIELLKKSQASIVNIGSVHSVSTSDEIAAYATTKAAIVGLTRNLAIELAPYKIRVNCISPGAVDTEMLRDGLTRGHAGSGTSDELVERLGQSHLLGKVGSSLEIANLVKFIADNKNGQFVNGANILIDGGASIRLSTE